jgi:hypothetical protein
MGYMLYVHTRVSYPTHAVTRQCALRNLTRKLRNQLEKTVRNVGGGEKGVHYDG